MKIDRIIFVLLLIFLASCTYPVYLSKSENIDINQYGSFITIYSRVGKGVKGELISIDTTQLIVLTHKNYKCVTVPMSEVRDFTLLYAKPVKYGWSIPLYMIISATQGAYGIYTLPLNLGVTIAVTASSHSAFTYNRKDMSFDKLKMFARFPGGIPAGIELKDITYIPPRRSGYK